MKIKGFRLPAFILLRLNYGWGRVGLSSQPVLVGQG